MPTGMAKNNLNAVFGFFPPGGQGSWKFHLRVKLWNDDKWWSRGKPIFSLNSTLFLTAIFWCLTEIISQLEDVFQSEDRVNQRQTWNCRLDKIVCDDPMRERQRLPEPSCFISSIWVEIAIDSRDTNVSQSPKHRIYFAFHLEGFQEIQLGKMKATAPVSVHHIHFPEHLPKMHLLTADLRQICLRLFLSKFQHVSRNCSLVPFHLRSGPNLLLVEEV